MDEINPQGLRDDFISLDCDNMRLFLELLTVEIPPEAILFILTKLDMYQKLRFTQPCYKAFAWKFLPVLLKEARRLARGELSNVSDEEFDKTFGEQIGASIYSLIRAIYKRAEERFRKKRDRKSDPETIRRNVEICELRKQDRKRWSLARLAKRFEVTDRYIRKVIQEEAKWRSLASDLGKQ